VIVKPAFTIISYKYNIYYAYPQDDLIARRSGVHVLGPDSDYFKKLGMDLIRSIFRLLRVYRNLLGYGIAKDKDEYWGGFLGLVLKELASLYAAPEELADAAK
jgi:hypothetical protein